VSDFQGVHSTRKALTRFVEDAGVEGHDAHA
jgi:hypothetical protein